MSTIRTRSLGAVGAAALLLAGFAAYRVEPPPAQAQVEPHVPEVDAAPAIEAAMPERRVFSGRIEAVEHVEIRPLVSGTIVGVHFRDGEVVRQGQRLFTIDPRPYQATLERAQGELEAAKAAASFARGDFERAKQLIGKSIIAQREYDTRERAVQDTEARLLIAQAAVASARLDLEHTTIPAPINGRISRAEVTLGNVVNAGGDSAPLSRIVSVSPVYASFDADEQSYLRFIGRAHDGSSAFPVDLALAGERGFRRAGRIASLDNRLDVATGTIRVRAVFENADNALIPGLYARVRVSNDEGGTSILVDPRAIGTDQDKKFVLVVGDDSRIAYREVRLGEERDGLRMVLSGLNAGERVVVSGAQAVKPGDQVKVNLVQAVLR